MLENEKGKRRVETYGYNTSPADDRASSADCPSFFRSESVQDRRIFPNFARPSTVTTANMKIWKDIFSGKLKDDYFLTFVGVIVDLL